MDQNDPWMEAEGQVCRETRALVLRILNLKCQLGVLYTVTQLSGKFEGEVRGSSIPLAMLQV